MSDTSHRPANSKARTVLALHVSSLQQLYTTEKPVREMADLTGLKIAAPSELGAEH